MIRAYTFTKRLVPILAYLLALSLVSILAEQTSDPPASTESPSRLKRQAEPYRIDITTTTGNTYTCAKVLRVNSTGITVLHSAGIATIPFAELPPNLREKYEKKTPKPSVASSGKPYMVRVAVHDDTQKKPVHPKAEIWFRGHGSW